MAKQQEQPQASFDAPPTRRKPRYVSDLFAGLCFNPNGRCLITNYFAPKALRGRLPDGEIEDSVDVHGTRPEALPFHRCNRGNYGKVWGHFFTTRPPTTATTAASGGGGRDDVRCVPSGGCCERYGKEKAYANEDWDAVAFRCRFSFYEEEDTLTPWRMKEFRLNEEAAAFRGVAFYPVAKDLVVWKVYDHVEIPEDEPLVDYHSSDDDSNGEDEAEEIAVEDPAGVVADVADACLDMAQRQQKKQKLQ